MGRIMRRQRGPAWPSIAILSLLLAAGCDDYAEHRRHGLGPSSAGLFALMGSSQRDREANPPAAPGSCEDTALLMGAHWREGMRARSAGDGEVTLDGFRILPPGGPGWCELIGRRRDAVAFVRNAYGGRAPATPPSAQQRVHLLMATGFLIRNDDGTPFTTSSVRRMLGGCVGGGRCAVQNEQSRATRIDGAECLVLTGRTVSDVSIDQIHTACIHPLDPRYVVKLTVAEIHRPDAPFDRPPLLETARAEYGRFLDSLHFTPVGR